MTVRELTEVLGEAPAPEGSWEREAAYVSAAALRRRVPPGELAARLAAVPGVSRAEALDTGFVRAVVAVPGALLDELEPPELAEPPWPDFPRTWENPGFVVRYGRARAAAVRRWARDLGVPAGGHRPELLTSGYDRAVLRVLAELPGRAASREPGWAAWLVRLALAYHDAHERAPAVPMGDGRPEPVHTARVRLAAAVESVLTGPTRI